MPLSDMNLSEALGEFKDRSPSGYAMGLHIKFTTPAYFFQSYPRAWLEYYSQAGLLLNDPTVSWCFENTGFQRWSDRDDPAGVLLREAEYGMAYGVSYATDTGGSLSMCGFTRPDREFNDAEIAELADRFEAMHVATQDQSALPADTLEQLKKMSIMVTHPGS